MLVSLTSTLVLAAAVIPCVLGAAKPLSPSVDPFYQPPKGYKSAPLGAILNSRVINSSVISSDGLAYQLLYRTVAVNGSAIADVTTVFKPAGAVLDRFVSFHTAYDSSAVQCNPSYIYQTGSNNTNPIPAFEEMFIQTYLKKGYIVASPDYEGPDAAFGAGRLAGKGVLDGMRAVINFKKTLGFNTSRPMIVGYGYSGGAIATGWAAGLQPNYARELLIKGWAFGGTPANLTGTTIFLGNTTFSGFIPAVVAGFLKPSAYGAQLQSLVNSIATTKGLAYIEYANTHCSIDDVINFGGKSLLSYDVQTLGPGLLQNDKYAAVTTDNLMGYKKSETPTAPVYMYHASGDEIIPYANASTLANTWCNNGASVQFLTITTGGHATAELGGFSGAVNFVESAFAGTVAQGCSRSSSLFRSLDTFDNVPEDVAQRIHNALEIAGPNDINIKKNPSNLRLLGSA